MLQLVHMAPMITFLTFEGPDLIFVTAVCDERFLGDFLVSFSETCMYDGKLVKIFRIASGLRRRDVSPGFSENSSVEKYSLQM